MLSNLNMLTTEGKKTKQTLSQLPACIALKIHILLHSFFIFFFIQNTVRIINPIKFEPHHSMLIFNWPWMASEVKSIYSVKRIIHVKFEPNKSMLKIF